MNDLGGHLTEPPVAQGTNVRTMRRSLRSLLFGAHLVVRSASPWASTLRGALPVYARIPTVPVQLIALPVICLDHDEWVGEHKLFVLANARQFGSNTESVHHRGLLSITLLFSSE